MSIRTCKIYKILNKIQESKNVMIHDDSYPEKEQKAKESNSKIHSVEKNWWFVLIHTWKINEIWNFKLLLTEKDLLKITRKSLIHVDSYKEIDKYLKKAYPKDF